MDDLTKWLKACLDAIELSDWHERTCQTHQKMPPNSPLGLGGSPLSCNCRVPDFVLRDVQARRRLAGLHVPANPDAKPPADAPDLRQHGVGPGVHADGQSRGDMIPIRRGTARRLGLRHPEPPPGLLVLAPSDLTDEQYEAFKAKWLAAWNAETRAIYASLPHGKPYLMPAIERATRPRRRWPWSRPSRSDTP